mmetsp:Transcript_42838/g.84160  ORF Transcript_42838/g.84160 Transcript_42838/m.84160 type:complete len:123 (+) Transcript_42838:100-468(+)
MARVTVLKTYAFLLLSVLCLTESFIARSNVFYRSAPRCEPTSSAPIPTFTPKTIGFDETRPPTFLQSRKDDGEDSDDDGRPVINIEEKDLPGIIFVCGLSFWHFLLGPALRPIILAARETHS